MLQKIWRSLANLAFPDFCEVCQTPLVKGERCICMSCLYKMPRTKFWNEDGNELEQLFWGKIHVEHACALFFFRKGSAFRPLIHKLKYLGKDSIGIRMGEELGTYLNETATYKAVDILVPVPLHPKKERIRGYNQSEKIASGIATVMNLPVETENLVRTHFTETQTAKSRIERFENVEKIFNVKNKNRLENKHIMLIDDVITTGATIEACATVLLNNCNCKISIASIGYVAE